MTDFFQPNTNRNVSWEEGLTPSEKGGFLLPDGAPALNVFPIRAAVQPSHLAYPVNAPQQAPAMLFGYKRSTVLIVGAIAAYLLLRRG